MCAQNCFAMSLEGCQEMLKPNKNLVCIFVIYALELAGDIVLYWKTLFYIGKADTTSPGVWNLSLTSLTWIQCSK